MGIRPFRVGAWSLYRVRTADNGPSNAVSRRVGYESDGAFDVAREGVAVLHNRFTMSRDRWEAVRSDHGDALGAPIVLNGVEGLRAQIGVAAP